MTPESLKTWRVSLGLSELGMAAYVGVPVHTWRKWENGQRGLDAAPARLVALLQLVALEAPAMHERMLASVKGTPGALDGGPPAAPKRRGKGKVAPAPVGAPSGAPATRTDPTPPAPPPPWIAAHDALPTWMKSGAASL